MHFLQINIDVENKNPSKKEDVKHIEKPLETLKKDNDNLKARNLNFFYIIYF